MPQGPFHFLGASPSRDVASDVYAVFGELQLPVTDTLNFQVAARYEDYGGQIGSTFNTKISGKWDLTDWQSLRGSYGTTFRGPPQVQQGNTTISTTYEFINGIFRAVNNRGNPGFEPEAAETLSAGLIFQAENLKISLDHWRFDFDMIEI